MRLLLFPQEVAALFLEKSLAEPSPLQNIRDLWRAGGEWICAIVLLHIGKNLP